MFRLSQLSICFRWLLTTVLPLGCLSLVATMTPMVIAQDDFTQQQTSARYLQTIDQFTTGRLVKWPQSQQLVFAVDHGADDDITVAIELAKVVRYGQPLRSSHNQGLLLVDGSFLPGEVRRITADVCELRGQYIRQTIPRSVVRAIVFAALDAGCMQQRLIDAALAADGADDQVWEIDGNRWQGVLEGDAQSYLYDAAGGGSLTIRVQGRQKAIDAQRLRMVVFSPLLTPRSTASATQGFVLGLDDGTLLQIANCESSDELGERKIALSCGYEFVLDSSRVPLDTVCFLSHHQPQQSIRMDMVRPLRLRTLPPLGPPQIVPADKIDVRWRCDSALQPAGFQQAAVHGIALSSTSQLVIPVENFSGGRFQTLCLLARPAETSLQQPVRFRIDRVTPEGTAQLLWSSEVPTVTAFPASPHEATVVDIETGPAAALVLSVERLSPVDWTSVGLWIDPILVIEH